MTLATKEQTLKALQEEQERELRDWFDALQSPATYRVFLRLLEGLGANRLMACEDDMRMRNLADQILDRIARAYPDMYIRMLRDLKQRQL